MSGLFRRQPFRGLALAAVAGIVAGDSTRLNPPMMLAVAAVLGVGAFRLRKNSLALLAVAALFSAGHSHRHFDNPARALAEIHQDGPKVVQGEGVVISVPAETWREDGRPETSFLLKVTSVRPGSLRGASAPVSARWRGGRPERGDVIGFAGSLRDIAAARNPGQFDFGGYQRREGVYSELVIPSAREVVRSGRERVAWWKRATLRTRAWMQRVLGAGIEDAPEVTAVIRSMVLGSKSEISDQTRRHFEQTGTLHIFVVSGLHVGLLGVIAAWLLTALGLSRPWAAAILLPILWAYAALTDFNPGSVRATVMGSVVLLSLICRRPAITWNTYFAALFLILAWDTEQLFQPGFQFSFGVVAAILLLAGRFRRFFARFGQPDPFLPRQLWRWHQRGRSAAADYVGGLAAVSLAAWVGSLFFTAQYFHLISPSALLANLLVVPLAGLILAQAILALGAGMFSLGLAAVFNHANWVLVKILLGGVGLFARMPGGHRYVELPSWEEKAEVEIVALDLGPGTAVALWAEGEVWLMDCGSGSAYRNIVRPYLRSRGVNRLDGFIISHGDAQHVGGGLDLLADFRPRQVITGAAGDRSPARQALQARLRAEDQAFREVRAGEEVPLAHGGSWRVFSPADERRQRLADDVALVLQLRSRGHRALFTSDAGFAVERRLLREEGLASDVLIKGMHRSDFSGTPGLIRRVGARCVVVADRIPFAEMPVTPLTDTAVEATGGTMLRQSETGAVRIRFFRDRIDWQTFLPDHRFTSRSE